MATNLQKTVDKNRMVNAPNSQGDFTVQQPPRDKQIRPSNANTGTSVDSNINSTAAMQAQLDEARNRLNALQTQDDTPSEASIYSREVANRPDDSDDSEVTVGESIGITGEGLNQFPTFEDVYGTPTNEEDIRRNTLDLFQQEIDATNQVYDQMLNEARLEGQGRLGSQRASAARGGLLGSDFAQSQKSKVQGFNSDIRDGIQAERTAAIGAIMGNVRSSVQEQLAEKRAARQQGAENYLAWLQNKGQRDAQNSQLIASDLINAGIDPSTLSEEELATITQEAGVAPESVLRTYRQLQAAQTEEEGDQFTLSSGERRFDAEGNLVAEGPTDLSDDSKIFSTSRGLVRVNPSTGESELIFTTGGSGSASSGETFKSGSLVVDGTQISDASRTLEETRDPATGYVDSSTYLDAYNTWTSSGGLPEDFFKVLDPAQYVDPSDETLPKNIRNEAEGSSDIFSTFGLSGTADNNAELEEIAEEEDEGGFLQRLFGG